MGKLTCVWSLADGTTTQIAISNVTKEASVKSWWLFDSEGNTLLPQVRSMVAIFEPDVAVATSEETSP